MSLDAVAPLNKIKRYDIPELYVEDVNTDSFAHTSQKSDKEKLLSGLEVTQISHSLLREISDDFKVSHCANHDHELEDHDDDDHDHDHDKNPENQAN